MFRNREIQIVSAVFLGITLIVVIAGYSIGPAAGTWMLIGAAALGTAFFTFTRARYKRLKALSDEIDRVLHDEGHLFIRDEDEGELSILTSEIAKMTVRLREQNEQLRAEKNHLADALADIAHQLRTPLTSANLILTLLKKEPGADERRALLRENEELFRQMDWLVTSLLKLSRLDAGIIEFRRERIDAGELIRAAIRPLLIPMELHDITLSTDVQPGTALTGDFAWLTEVLENLVKNCMESAGDGGKVGVSAVENALYTEIRVFDSGRGIDAEDMAHLFERFYRGKHAGATGYGIGLALAKSIVTGQGGAIYAKNRPEGGALFAVRFQK